MRSRINFACTIVVLFTFLYSGFIWAEGLSSQTLAQDTNKIINTIFSQTNPSEVESRWQEFVRVHGVLDYNNIYKGLVSAILENGGDSELLNIYREIIFIVFAKHLQGLQIEKDKTTVSVSHNGEIILASANAQYKLSIEKDKVNITKIEKRDIGMPVSSALLGLLPFYSPFLETMEGALVTVIFIGTIIVSIGLYYLIQWLREDVFKQYTYRKRQKDEILEIIGARIINTLKEYEVIRVRDEIYPIVNFILPIIVHGVEYEVVYSRVSPHFIVRRDRRKVEEIKEIPLGRGKKLLPAGIDYERRPQVQDSTLINAGYAVYLGNRLAEEGVLKKREIDQFVSRMTSTNSMHWIVLSMAANRKGINFEHIKESLNAVRRARNGIFAANLEFSKKATLVLAGQMNWDEERENTIKDLLGKDLIREIHLGLVIGGYDTHSREIFELLLMVRKEMGQMAQMGDGSLRISSPYVHMLLLRVAKMARINARILIRAFYGDLIKEEAKASTMKTRLVNAAVENALVESWMTQERGLMNFTQACHPVLEKAVFNLALIIYKEKSTNLQGEGFIVPVDKAIGIEPSADPFGIIESLFSESPFNCEIECEKQKSDTDTVLQRGELPLLELLHMDRSAVDITSVTARLPEDSISARNNLIISLGNLLEIEEVDVETKEIKIRPKALGVSAKIKTILSTGGTVKIVASEIPEGLKSVTNIQEVLKEAVQKYLGIQKEGLTVEIGTIEEVFNKLGDKADSSSAILTSKDAGYIRDNKGVFIYIPHTGELLGDVINIVFLADFEEDGSFSNDFKEKYFEYIKRQVPGIERMDIWPEVNSSINHFNIKNGLFFSLPDIVRLSERFKEIGLYRIAILVSA
jgi:hypothetical protein